MKGIWPVKISTTTIQADLLLGTSLSCIKSSKMHLLTYNTMHIHRPIALVLSKVTSDMLTRLSSLASSLCISCVSTSAMRWQCFGSSRHKDGKSLIACFLICHHNTLSINNQLAILIEGRLNKTCQICIHTFKAIRNSACFNYLTSIMHLVNQ